MHDGPGKRKGFEWTSRITAGKEVAKMRKQIHLKNTESSTILTTDHGKFLSY
jgi:hypothetical protein